jgi:S1-C subfamily serine protease
MPTGIMPRLLLLLPACLLLAGCGSTAVDRPGDSQVGSRSRAELQAGDVFAAAAAGAQDDAATDFGLTVLTNRGVRQGGAIKWIVIGAVAPRSHAELAGLAIGDEIMAVDGQVLEALEGDVMLRGLFGRRMGDRIRLLVYKPSQTLPYFVDLIAGRQAPAN